MTTREQLQETLCDRLFWHTAERDDSKVADHLFHCREMNVVYAMDEATLFDSFFNYLQEIEARNLSTTFGHSLLEITVVSFCLPMPLLGD